MDVREFKEIGLMVVTLNFYLEIPGQTWHIQYDISGSIYRRNLFLDSISTKSISRNSLKYIPMLWPWPLTLKIKVKHDNAINMITLVNVETYFGVHKYWIDVAELKKYISILWPWPLTLKFKVKHDVTHLIWLIW